MRNKEWTKSEHSYSKKMAMAMAMEENGMKNKIRVAVLFGSLVFGFQLKIVKFTVKVFKRERKVAHGNNNNNTSAFCVLRSACYTTNQPCRRRDVIDDFSAAVKCSHFVLFLFRGSPFGILTCNFDRLNFVSCCFAQQPLPAHIFWFAFHSHESNPINRKKCQQCRAKSMSLAAG